jgi:glutamyl-tRNA reductase
MLHGAMAELRSGDHTSRERAREAAEHFFLRDAR